MLIRIKSILSPFSMFLYALMFVSLTLWTESVKGQHYVVEDPEVDKFRGGKPDLNDDFTQSPVMPKELRCDGCILLAYKMSNAIQAAHDRRVPKGSRKQLSESQLIDLFDKTCNDRFENYGVKEIGGQLRLSGEGLEAASVPGIMQGGGLWPTRLRGMCHGYVGALDGEDIYLEGYVYTRHDLEGWLCHGPAPIRNDCAKSGKRPKQEKKSKDASKKKEETDAGKKKEEKDAASDKKEEKDESIGKDDANASDNKQNKVKIEL